MNKRLYHLFVICEERSKYSLGIHSIAKKPLESTDRNKFDQLIQSEISQEIILLSSGEQGMRHTEKEFKKIISEAMANGEISVSDAFVDLSFKTMQKAIIIFGYHEQVNQLKKELLSRIESDPLIVFKFDSLKDYQVRHRFSFNHNVKYILL